MRGGKNVQICKCADVQMKCGEEECVDDWGKECADVQMCRCADKMQRRSMCR
jgi:hypothetical protein